MEYILKKYPKNIFTFKSAYLYLGLSDYIPNIYYVATSRNSKRIPLSDIKQTYESDDFYGLGITSVNINETSINVYDKERMLIELIRSKNVLSFDYYKGVVNVYREEMNELDMDKLMDYLDVFNNSENILEKLNREVF